MERWKKGLGPNYKATDRLNYNLEVGFSGGRETGESKVLKALKAQVEKTNKQLYCSHTAPSTLGFKLTDYGTYKTVLPSLLSTMFHLSTTDFVNKTYQRWLFVLTAKRLGSFE